MIAIIYKCWYKNWRNNLSKESGVFYVKGVVTEMTFTVTVMTIEFCFPQLFFVTMTSHW